MFKKFFPSSSDFTKNTFTLVLGTIVAQAIPFILHPFLRRLYSPEDFGAMAVYLNLFGVVTIVSALRYEAAIVLPKYNNEAANLLSLTFIINVVFTVLIFTALLFFKNDLVQFLNFPVAYSNYLYLLPFGSLLYGCYQSMNYWLIRQKAFKASTTNKIIRRLVEGSVQTTFGVLRIPGGLFIGDLLGNLANVISGVKQIIKNFFSLKQVSATKIHFVANKYKDYPKFNVLPTLLSSAANVLPFLFINKMYSTETVGYLDLSKLVLSVPLVFISSTISQVLFQQITSKKHDSLSIKGDFKNVFLVLISVIILELMVIFLFGPWLFGFAFGSNYELSGKFSQILIFSFALNFIGSTFSSVFITFNKLKLNSRWQIVYFIAICSLYFFKNLSISNFLILYVAIEVAMHLCYCLIIYYIINEYEKSIRLRC
jgi:O-antigen/teichoic acid export membrane protein